MRHRIAGRKLARSPAHRLALARNLVKALFAEFDRKGYIVTTREKAKFVQPRLERTISLGREKTLPNIRRARSFLEDRALVSVLFDKIGPYYRERRGGYTRILRLGRGRLGDNASRVYFGFVRNDEAAEEVAPDAAPAGEGA